MEPQVGLHDGRTRSIANWAMIHTLQPEEIVRIQSALEEPEAEIDAAMLEELQGVLAARRISRVKKPTAESMKAIGDAFEEGRLSVKSLPVD